MPSSRHIRKALAERPTRGRSMLVARLHLERRIHLLRGERVMLSLDLAELYGVEARTLVQGVKRNASRFPPDFMFQLTSAEWSILKSHSVISSHGGIRRALPYAFTEQGASMLSSVLRSQRAIAVNIEIMRAFVRFRRIVSSNEDLARKVAALESRYDGRFQVVFDALRQIMRPPLRPRRHIGFGT
jgi:hypothetical protein